MGGCPPCPPLTTPLMLAPLALASVLLYQSSWGSSSQPPLTAVPRARQQLDSPVSGSPIRRESSSAFIPLSSVSHRAPPDSSCEKRHTTARRRGLAHPDSCVIVARLTLIADTVPLAANACLLGADVMSCVYYSYTGLRRTIITSERVTHTHTHGETIKPKHRGADSDPRRID